MPISYQVCFALFAVTAFFLVLAELARHRTNARIAAAMAIASVLAADAVLLAKTPDRDWEALFDASEWHRSPARRSVGHRVSTETAAQSADDDRADEADRRQEHSTADETQRTTARPAPTAPYHRGSVH